ncbi:MAG: sigma-70 family RNA polymerase sigma factor [Planctomycetaceae bacterium]|nr:sigma-70 family RNA polymerase sigma factor [Planctomycetaceae bacterium]
MNGDEEALGRLLEHFRSRLRETIHANIQGPLQRRIDESDVIQQACLRAINVFSDQFQGNQIEEFWAWLERIQQNTLIDLVRNHQAQRRDARQHQSEENVDIFAGKITSPSQKAIQGEKRHKIEAAISQLPESQQSAVRLRHLEGYKITEVADILGKTPAATAQIIYRGISTLKKILEQDTYR